MELFNLLTQPYFLLNLASLGSYFYVRQRYLNQKMLDMVDVFGFSREISISMVFCLIISARYRDFTSLKNFLISAIYYGKILVMILVALGGNLVALGIYICVFIALWFAVDLPKYTGPTKMIELAGPTFQSLFDPQSRIETAKGERYIFCVFYANFSFNSILVV